MRLSIILHNVGHHRPEETFALFEEDSLGLIRKKWILQTLGKKNWDPKGEKAVLVALKARDNFYWQLETIQVYM